MAKQEGFPPRFFDREDENDDARFYSTPRLVVHIDPGTIEALTEAYRELLPADGAVLDLMSAWVSHLPDEMSFGRVAGLGTLRDRDNPKCGVVAHTVSDEIDIARFKYSQRHERCWKQNGVQWKQR